MKKVELVAKTIGVNEYDKLSLEEITSAVARHGIIKEDNGKLVKYLMEHKHYSPLEAVHFTFKIETKRAIATQIFRHRSLNPQERSLRYDKVLGEKPVQDIELRLQAEKNRQSSTDTVASIAYSLDNNMFIYSSNGNLTAEQTVAVDMACKSLNDTLKAYNSLVDSGIARECARDILPLATTTHIHITGSLRSFLSFLNVRMDSHAQKDIVEIAEGIGNALEAEMPNVFAKIDWRKGMFM